MSGTLKPWLVLAVIFIAGGLSGAALTMVLDGHFGHSPGGPDEPRPDMQKMWMLRLISELKLTPDQQAKIEPILRDTAEKVRAVHRTEFDEASQILKQSDDQIAELLTPEQKAQLQKMVDERNKAFSQHKRQWGPPRDGGPDGGGHFRPGPDGGGPPDQQPPPPPPPAPPATNAPSH